MSKEQLNIPATMLAWQIIPDGNGDMVLREMDTPAPAEGEILIKTSHAGINRADIFQREGTYPAPVETNHVPGLELSGEVVALGEGAKRYKVGDKVCAITIGGGYAEYCTVPAGQALPVPEGVPMDHAAALPEALATVWMSLCEMARLCKGETVLIHGGASGIGTAAIQLAKLREATVIATAGSDEKCDACRKLGAHAINYHTEDYVAHVKAITENKGVDVLLDMVGGEYVNRNLQSLGMHGRMVSIALLGGSKAEISLGRMLMKNITWYNLTLRSRGVEEKSWLMKQLEMHMWLSVADKSYVPVIDSVFALEEMEKAHQKMQQGLHIGKIILKVA